MADAQKTEVAAPADAAETKKEEKIVVPNFISRIKISNTHTHGKITLREYDNISEISGAPLIQGFPNPTSDNMITGIIITSYIVQHLKLPLVGDLVSQNFPPMAVVKSGIPAPGARIYGNKNLVVIASEFTIKDAEILHDVVQATIAFANRHKLSMVIGLDAVAGNLSETVNLLDQIQIAANSDEMGEEGDEDYEDYDDDGGEDDAMDAVPDQKVQVNELSVATASAPKQTSLALHTSNKKEASKIAKKLGSDKKKDSKKSGEKKDAKKPKDKKSKTASAEDEGEEDDDEDDDEEEKIDVWFITNSQNIGDSLKSLGMEPAIECSVNGVQGGLINESRFTDLPIVLMLASLDKLELGARPALVLVEAVQKLLTKLGSTSLGIDLSKLQESTTSLESKIGEIMKKMQQGAPKPDDSKMNMLYM